MAPLWTPETFFYMILIWKKLPVSISNTTKQNSRPDVKQKRNGRLMMWVFMFSQPSFSVSCLHCASVFARCAELLSWTWPCCLDISVAFTETSPTLQALCLINIKRIHSSSLPVSRQLRRSFVCLPRPSSSCQRGTSISQYQLEMWWMTGGGRENRAPQSLSGLLLLPISLPFSLALGQLPWSRHAWIFWSVINPEPSGGSVGSHASFTEK